MTITELVELFEYNRWANERILEAASALTDEQYSSPLRGTFPSLRLTMEHLLAAEVVWLSRWEGHSLGEAPEYSGCENARALRSIWISFWRRQFQYLSALGESDLGQAVSIRTRSGIETVQQLRDTMIHVVNHSTQHRGDAASQIVQLGGSPSSTDYFTYCLIRDAGTPMAPVVP